MLDLIPSTKKRTTQLFALARQDLDVGRQVLDNFPNIAAFHAQQCAEKSLKAILVELSDVQSEEEIRPRIRHNSIMAVLGVLGQIVRDVAKRSGLPGLESTLRSARNDKKSGSQLAWLLYFAFTSAYSDFFTLFQSPPIAITKEVWAKSLDPQLVPDPSVDPVWKRKSETLEETIGAAWDVMWSSLGIESGPTFAKMTSNPSDAKFDLERMARELELKGHGDIAESARRAIENIDAMLKPGQKTLPWIKLVIGWAPYLDSHAVWPRYSNEEESRFYRSHKEGVRNLLQKAQEIMDATKGTMADFSSRFG